jgi:hypothetical protein
MKKLFLTLLLVSLYSCFSQIEQYNQIHGEYTKYQVDSILTIDSIPTDFKHWIGGDVVQLVDFETGDTIRQWLYIKQLEDKKKREIIYTITSKDTIFVLNKRITEKTK